MLSTPSAPAPLDLSLRYAYDVRPRKTVGFEPSTRKALQRSFSSTSHPPHPDAVQRSPVQSGVLDASHPWLSASDRSHWVLQLALALTAGDVIAATRAWRGLAASLYPCERTGGLFTRRDRAGGALLLQTHERRPRAALADAIEGLTKAPAWLALCATGSRFSRLAVLPTPVEGTAVEAPSSADGAPLVIAVEVSESTKQKGWTMPLNEFLATASDAELDGLWAWDLRPRSLDAGAVHTLWSTVRAIRSAGDDAKAAARASQLIARSTPVSTPHRGPRLAPAIPDPSGPTPSPVPARLRRVCPRKTTPTSSSERKREFTPPPPHTQEDERGAAKAYRAERKRVKVTTWLTALSLADEDEDADVGMDVEEKNEQDEEGEERECVLVFVGAAEFEELMEQRLGSERPWSAGSGQSTA